MENEKVTLKKLDELGKKLIALKEKKADISAKLAEVTSEHTALQEMFIDLLLEADKTSWSIKGKGTLTLSGKDYFSIIDRKKFEEFSRTPEAISLGLTFELLESQLKISLDGMSELLKEVVKKFEGSDLKEKIGLSYFRKNNVTRSKK